MSQKRVVSYEYEKKKPTQIFHKTVQEKEFI